MALAQEATIATSDAIEQESFCNEDYLESYNLLGVSIASTDLDRAIETVESWVESWLEKPSRAKMVTFSSVHMLTEAHKSPRLFRALGEIDLKCPDGMPLVWLGKLKGRAIERVAGPDFMPAFCAATAAKGYRHFFYGGQPGVAERVIANLKKTIPSLQIAGWYSAPYMDQGTEEDVDGIRAINESGADVVWICLGCPKQELWMWQHRRQLKAAVLLSVGMAFDIVAGTKKRAPRLLRNNGLEWLYRLMVEPRRLMARYFSSNLTFLHLLLTGRAFTERKVRPGEPRFVQEIARQ
jgi:N-acetylglucosaminyldiphosphoundecaprenol N-acetyl-beta-D-mannosaminyltransferase